MQMPVARINKKQAGSISCSLSTQMTNHIYALIRLLRIDALFFDWRCRASDASESIFELNLNQNSAFHCTEKPHLGDGWDRKCERKKGEKLPFACSSRTAVMGTVPRSLV